VDRYVSLHRHDGYSVFDGLGTARLAANAAAGLEQPALALTNHGNVFGLMDHLEACDKAGIKPILGVELYVTESAEKPEDRKLAHQTVLAQTMKGYRNLMRLVTRANERLYYKPRACVEDLIEFQEDLIILSGCPSSLINRALEAGEEERARALLERMASELRGRFWVEIQHHKTAQANAPWLIKQAQRLKLPVVATNDAHYVDGKDRQAHDLLLKIRWKGRGEENPSYGSGYHILSRKEFGVLLLAAHPWATGAQVRGWLDETVAIADSCEDLKMERPKRLLPPLWEDSIPRLRMLAAQGMQSRGLLKKLAYVKRLRRELQVIEQLGYADYFHICSEVTQWARSEDILIGPRGSVCGSLLAYVLGVTTVDPLVHDTMFERFLHEDRKKSPDVDLDIDSRHHARLQRWVLEKYAPYATQIVTFGRYGGGRLSQDLIGGVPELGEDGADELRTVLDEYKHQRLEEITAEEIDGQLSMQLTQRCPELPYLVSTLYNQVTYVGKHPGGIVFAPGDHARWYAKILAKEEWLASYDGDTLEDMGLVKIDFLGLHAMRMLRQTMEAIGKRDGAETTLDSIPLDDHEVFGRFARGQTQAVFQFERRGAQSVLRTIEPDNFAELVAATSLVRPGVMDSLPSYVEGKRKGLTHGEFADTYGTIIFQEQIMARVRGLGFTWAQCDEFLQLIKSMKYNQASVSSGAVELAPFMIEVAQRLVEREDLTLVDAKMYVARMAQYSFNKAHAVGYSLVSYWMLWMRTRYPLEFWCSVLDSEPNDKKRREYQRSAAFDGLIFLPPHINATQGFSIEDNAIRVGYRTLPGVGEKAAAEIQAHAPYETPHEILNLPRRTVNTRVIKVLHHEGALIMDQDRFMKHAVKYNEELRG